jgi:hypothetical protein
VCSPPASLKIALTVTFFSNVFFWFPYVKIPAMKIARPTTIKIPRATARLLLFVFIIAV